jgi:hypothetical protein
MYIYIPIRKGRNVNSSISENFCGIAPSSTYGKLFDHIMLERYEHQISSCELQFGFKNKSSTSLCSMVLRKLCHTTSVFCTFLDANKAFDRVHYCKSLKPLIKRKLPACVIKVLINLYTHNFLRIAWCGIMTGYFSVANEVK